MTREEAIGHIKDIICENNTVKHSDMVVFENEKEALHMAIQALELDYKTAFQIACALLNGDILYGTDAESIFSEIMKKDGCVCSFDYENYILTHLNELRDDKALSQEPCVKPTTEDAIKTIQELMIACTPDSKYYRVGQMAISAILENEELSKDLDEALREIDEYEQGKKDALSQEPCDDAISRAFIEPIIEELENICINGDEYILNLLADIKNAPTVTPSNERIAFLEHELKVNVKKWKDAYEEGKKDGRPKGCWVAIDEEPHEDYECDKCGYVCSTFSANIKPSDEYKYCPNCGARMESDVIDK